MKLSHPGMTQSLEGTAVDDVDEEKYILLQDSQFKVPIIESALKRESKDQL
jgi:hypothetical protein